MQEFWVCHFLPNNLREFILKFNSNLLGINTRVSNFVENRERACTFCLLNRIHNPPDETFLHIFLDCPQTRVYLRYFEVLIFREKNFDQPQIRKNLWFYGIYDLNFNKNNYFLGTCIWVVKNLIWVAKLSKKMPTNLAMREEFFYIMGGIFDISIKVRLDKLIYDNFFCRNWNELRRA